MVLPMGPKTMTQSIAQIRKAVAEMFGVPERHLLAPRRDHDAAHARHVAMYLAREITGETYGVIARAFKRGDHTTAILACRKIAGQIAACRAKVENAEPVHPTA